MPIEMHLVVRPYGLTPASAIDEEAMGKFPLGATIKATVIRPRSRPMERFYWALMTKVAKGIGFNKEGLSDEVMRVTGRMDSFILSNGWQRVRAKRISEMDHYSFLEYVDEAVEVLLRVFLSGTDRAALLSEIETMLGVSYEDAQADLRKRARNERGIQPASGSH